MPAGREEPTTATGPGSGPRRASARQRLLAAYSATKGALASMTRSWAAEFSPAGVRVNAVAAGPVYTPIQPREAAEAVGAGTIMGRGRPA